MDKYLPPISIEKFAAYLDGNLSQDEIENVSSLANEDDSIKELLKANNIIEDTLSSYKDKDLKLPDEIESMSFEIPKIQSNTHSFISLSPESFSYSDVAACAADDFGFGDSEDLLGDMPISTESDGSIHLSHDDGNIIDTDTTPNITEDL